MSKYFFNVHDGLGLTDDEGVECPNLDAAIRTAVHYAGSLLKDSDVHLRLGDTWTLEVSEEAKPSAFCIDLQIRPALASATAKSHRSAA